MKTAFLFPGQGSQSVGMGLDLYNNSPKAREIFQEIDDALFDKIGEKLSSLIFNGPIEKLTLTEYAQPAIMAVSVATMSAMLEYSGKLVPQMASAVAGHSLGEYSALAIAGSLGIGDTARLLNIRGRAMQAAVPAGKGGMAALMGANWQDADKLCKILQGEGYIIVPANDNCPGQVVISGQAEAITRAGEIAKELGIKRVFPLPVSAPFHSPMMQPAAVIMAEALQATIVQDATLPIYSNINAEPCDAPEVIIDNLVKQVCGVVRFREIILNMTRDGFTNFVEIGNGKVLAGLVQKINPEAKVLSIGNMEDIKNFFG